jgi:hypothetical protein
VLNSIPWNTKAVNKAMGGGGFQFAYSRDLKTPMAAETSLSIDLVATLYNCIVVQSRLAQSANDLKTRGQELAKAVYYCNFVVKQAQNYPHLLQNVDAHSGQGYFQMLTYLFEAQCAETQAILRSQVSNLLEDQAFNQFIGLMALAESNYKRATGLLMGVPNCQQVAEFATKRQRATLCALLYVNAAHNSTSKPGQSLKDAMTASELVKDCDLVDFNTV